jgi:hypothetical protein
MWSSELSESEARWAALLLVDLMLRPKDWIHRRVETVAFDDHQSATRGVLVDFSIPDPSQGLRDSFPTDATNVTLPVAIMRKRRMRVFQLTDEAGRLWPVLTRTTRAYVAQSALTLLAQEVLDGSTLDYELQRDLENMASEAIPTAYELHGKFVEAALLDKQTLAKTDEQTKQRATLYKNTAFRIVAYTLVWSYVLLVQVPNESGARRVLSFSYEDRPARAPKRDAVVDKWVAMEQRSTLRERLGWRVKQVCRAAGRSLGWSSRRFIFPCASVVYGQTYHFEVAAPPGSQISSGALYLTSDWSPRRNPYKVGLDDAIKILKRNAQATDRESGSLRRSHLYVRDTLDTGQGIAEIEVRPEQNTLVQGIFLTALLSLLLLGVGLLFRPKLEVDAATTLLLLLPTVLVVYVVQPSAEHALVARLLLAVRGFGIIVGLCLIGASGALIVAPKGQPPSLVAWWIAFGVAAVATVVLMVAWIQARPRKYRSSEQTHR